jgi:hypothetical protein
MKTVFIITAVTIILAAIFQPVPKQLLVGVYYYPWWGERHWLKYPVSGEPLLGKYSSANPQIAEEHIKWAKEFGIDFFVVSWWNRNSYLDENIKNGFLKARNIGDIKFAIFYESPNCLGQKIPIDFNAPAVKEKFINDFNYLAETFFKHPSYFKIGGHPVVVIYLTRVFTGDFPAAVAQVRENLKKKGFNVYFIGDEIWWNPVPASSGAGATPAPPSWNGLTAYNLYYPAFSKDGIKNTADLADKIKMVYENWQKYLSGDSALSLIPGIIPQYDDYKLRKNPPLYAAAAEDFLKMLEVAKNSASPVGPKKQKIILITSWNEWHEGTAIEPGKMNFEDEFIWLKTLKNWQQ